MTTVIIVAKSIKEAKQIALTEYNGNAVYIKPYLYASRGNNFYEFSLNP